MTSNNLNILRASSSLNTTQKEKRKIGAAAWGEHSKRQRHSQPNFGAWLDGVPAAASNAATMAFPMVGVNGPAPRWSTAAALGASSRAVALPLPRATAAAGGAHRGLQSLGAAGGPQMAGVNGVVPLVLAHAAGQLVPLPVHFYGYAPAAGGFASAAAPAGGGPPLAAALDSFRSTTLTRMLSALMPVCDPPLRHYHSRAGAPPPWWPTASEPWWATEVAAHLVGMPPGPVPFVASKLLDKADKVAVLVAIVKHLSPDFARVTAATTSKCRLSAPEAALWHAALQNEQAKSMRPVFVVQLQQPYGGGGGYRLPASHNVVHDAVAAATHGSHQAEQGGNVDATIFSASDLGGQQLEDVVKPFLPKQADRSDEGIGPSNAAVAAKVEPEGRRSWYKNEERCHWFANMPFIGSPHSFDHGWYF